MRKILVFLILFAGCNSNKIPKASPEFIALLNKEKKFDNTSLKLNGYYALYPEDAGNQKRVGPVNPMLFYGNGIIYWRSRVSFNDSKSFGDYYTKYALEQSRYNYSEMGTYEVKNDSIHAMLFCWYNKDNVNIYDRELTYFTGLIKGDSITKWQMVKPYPSMLTAYPRFNQDFFKIYSNPRTFHFSHFAEKTQIDSGKFYVNEYRKHPSP